MDYDMLLPRGWEWLDELDPFCGVTCPHGESTEIDSAECSDGCKNPVYDL
jgi:hypothetical protein